MKSKSQLNVLLPKTIAAKIRADARRSGRTLDAVAETIFSDFFSAWSVSERSKFYEHTAPKRLGRKIAA